MKTAIAMTLTLLLAAGLGTAFATPLPLLIRQDNSQSPPAMPQQQQPQPGNPQAAVQISIRCSASWIKAAGATSPKNRPNRFRNWKRILKRLIPAMTAN